MNNRLLRLARPLAFVLGSALTILAIYTYALTVKLVIQNPSLVSPDKTLWTTKLINQALNSLGLPANFLAVYSLSTGLLFSLAFLTCGWLILLRKNQDWFGLFMALLLLGWANIFNAFTTLPSVSEGINTFLSYFSWFTWAGLFLVLYFFPSGHVTPRWARWFALGWGLFSVYGLTATILDRLPEEFIYFIPILFAVMLVGGYSQFYRYRHAGVLERQQIKWVVTSLLLLVVSFSIVLILSNLTGLGNPDKSGLAGAFIYYLISSTIGNLVFISVPISIALAMLRYRLWDVDVIIRRTLIYGVLSAALALVFFGVVTLLQRVFQAVSGQQSAVSIVVSTLAITALFNPLRIRIQEGIDRRFFRQKYNAEKALAAFATAARNETDLDQLKGELLLLVQETIQPESASLWLAKVTRRGKTE